MRALVVMTPARSGIFPDVPTVAESGFHGFEASVWYGFIGQAALPVSVVARLHAEIERARYEKLIREAKIQPDRARPGRPGQPMNDMPAGGARTAVHRGEQGWRGRLEQSRVRPD